MPELIIIMNNCTNSINFIMGFSVVAINYSYKSTILEVESLLKKDTKVIFINLLFQYFV